MTKRVEILQEYGIRVIRWDGNRPKRIRVIAQDTQGDRWELEYELRQIDEARESWQPVFTAQREQESVQTMLLEDDA